MDYKSPPNVIALTRRDIEDLYPSLRDAHQFIETQRSPEKTMVNDKEKENQFIKGLATFAGAAGVGFLAGRTGSANIGTTKVPLGLVLGAAGYGLAYFNLTGQFSKHVVNLSNGAFAGWGTLWAAGEGTRMREKAGGPAGPIVAGYDYKRPAEMPAYQPPMMNQAPMQMPSPLTEAELQVMAQNQSYRR